MSLNIIDKQLNGLIVFAPNVFSDDRGFFYESYKKSYFDELGFEFVQDNHSLSKKDVIRGMHFQWDKPQGKLIRVTSGSALFFEVDIRKNSEHLGKYFSIELNTDNKYMLWVPPGFANGFLALEDNTEVQYKCTEYWNPNAEGTILWNDSQINIEWNIKNPVISDKDAFGITLEDWLNRPESCTF